MDQEEQKRYTYMQQDRKKERTEWCWVYGTIDTEEDTDMQPYMRTVEKTEWCWVYGTIDTEEDTDMQPDRRTGMTEWCWVYGTRDTEKIYRYAAR